MDNPQHYQPLSHALNPHLAAQPQYPASASNFVSGSTGAEKVREEEEEEEEEEDDDEGMVEEQLHENDRDLQHPISDHPSPSGEGQQSAGPAETNGHTTEPTTNDVEQHDDQNSPPKRRPGRPRGSKNRMKAKAAADAVSATSKKAFQQPSAPANVNAQNQQYYEFQWRVLNLCAEFYGAAEELVKATPPLVIAQSYQMGPSVKIDPINMLAEAKKICDTLLANPSQLTTHPPTPMYTQIASFGLPPSSTAPSQAPSIGKFSAKPSPVPTNVQSFAVPIGAQAGAIPQQTQYIQAAYPPQPAPQFPTLPYYYAPPYAGAPFIPVPSVAPAMSPANQLSAVGGVRGEGAWTDEEQERLKQLAEQSKSVGKAGDIEWDWVVHQWGNSRTRHQILIKATALGLKVSSTRGQKRRRESSHGADEDGTPAPASTASASAPGSVVPQATSISPPLSQPVSAHPSPAIQHSHPPAVAPAAPARVSWPAPIIAANTSPIVTSSESQRGSYYRHRPSDPSMKPDSLSSHHYVYQPNGKGTGSSKFSKQNGQ